MKKKKSTTEKADQFLSGLGTSGGAIGSPQLIGFGGAADRDPQNAWRYLNAAQQNPEVFRQKLLVME